MSPSILKKNPNLVSVYINIYIYIVQVVSSNALIQTMECKLVKDKTERETPKPNIGSPVWTYSSIRCSFGNCSNENSKSKISSVPEHLAVCLWYHSL